MANIDINAVLQDCITKAQSDLGTAWNDAKPFAEQSFKQFAEDAEFLANLRLTNQIDDAELKDRFSIQWLAVKNVLLTIEGIGLIAAQNTVNDIIGIVTTAIQTALNVAIPI